MRKPTSFLFTNSLVAAILLCLAGTAEARKPDAPRAIRADAGALQTQSLIVVVPASRDALLGYSVETGQWRRQPIKPAADSPIVPIASGHVAAVRVGNELFAFSALKGRWDSAVTAPDPKSPTASEFLLGDDLAVARVGPQVFGFSSFTGRWDSITLSAGSQAAPVADGLTAIVRDGGTFWVFSAKSGGWTAIDLKSGKLIE